METRAIYSRTRISELNSSARQSVNSQSYHVNMNDSQSVSCGTIAWSRKNLLISVARGDLC